MLKEGKNEYEKNKIDIYLNFIKNKLSGEQSREGLLE